MKSLVAQCDSKWHEAEKAAVLMVRDLKSQSSPLSTNKTYRIDTGYSKIDHGLSRYMGLQSRSADGHL
jgi:hypothetical protein